MRLCCLISSGYASISAGIARAKRAYWARKESSVGETYTSASRSVPRSRSIRLSGAAMGEARVESLRGDVRAVEGEDCLIALEAASAISETGVEEGATDALVVAHAGGELFHIGTEAVADACHLIDEGDLRRQEGVGGVLDHLRGIDVGDDDRRAQGNVEPGGALGGGAVRRAQHDAVRLHEILHSGAFAQELGIRNHGDLQRRIAQMLAHHMRHEIAAADGHRALVDDDNVTGEMLGDGA